MKYGLIVITFILMSCHSRNNYEIDNVPLAQTIWQLVDSIEIVPLESIQEALIGEVRKVVIKDSNIYILDRKQNSLFHFSSKGKFLKKIQDIGGAPHEYQMMMDFIVDEKNNFVYGLTPFKLIKYNRNLEFLESIKIPYIAHYIDFFNDSVIALYQIHEKKRVKLYNLKRKKEIGAFHKIPSYFNNLKGSGCTQFYKKGGNLYFQSTSTNDIYEITLTGLNKHFSFFPDADVDFTNLPKDKEEKFYITYFLNGNAGSKVPYQHSPGFTNKTMQCAFRYKGKIGVYMISKKDSSRIQFYNEKDKVMYLGAYACENFTYGCIEPDELLDMLSDKSNIGIMKYEEDLLMEDITMQNPCVIKYYIKETFNEI